MAYKLAVDDDVAFLDFHFMRFRATATHESKLRYRKDQSGRKAGQSHANVHATSLYDLSVMEKILVPESP